MVTIGCDIMIGQARFTGLTLYSGSSNWVLIWSLYLFFHIDMQGKVVWLKCAHNQCECVSLGFKLCKSEQNVSEIIMLASVELYP